MTRNTETDRFTVQARDAAEHMKRLLSGYDIDEVVSITVEIERETDQPKELPEARPPVKPPSKRESNETDEIPREADGGSGGSQTASGGSNATAPNLSGSVGANREDIEYEGNTTRVGYDPETDTFDLEDIYETGYHATMTELNAVGDGTTGEVSDRLEDKDHYAADSVSSYLSRMHEVGLVDRDGRAPFTYHLTDRGREVLYQIGPHPDLYPSAFSTGTEYYKVASYVRDNPGVTTTEAAEETGVTKGSASAAFTDLRYRCVVARVGEYPHTYEITPYGKYVLVKAEEESGETVND